MRSFFFGPELANEYCESLDQVDYLLDDVWCEGAALLDWDAKLLAFFEGHVSYRPELRQHLLTLMSFNWPGWEVRWAGGDIAEIAIRLGFNPASVRAIEYGDGAGEAPDWDSTLEWIGSLLTVSDRGVVRDYCFECGIEKLLAVGPQLLERLQGRSTSMWTLDDLDDLGGGGLINTTEGVIDLWFEWTMDDGRFERLRRHWPGWAIRRHDEGLPRHLQLSGRDPAIGQVGERAAILEIARLLFEGDSFDPGMFLGQLIASGEEVQFVHPGFLKVDHLEAIPRSNKPAFAVPCRGTSKDGPIRHDEGRDNKPKSRPASILFGRDRPELV